MVEYKTVLENYSVWEPYVWGMTDDASDETETPDWRAFSSGEQNDQDFSSLSRGNSDKSGFWDRKTAPSVQTKLLHKTGEDIHETMIEAVKDFDENGGHSTGIRIVSNIENGPYTYTITSYDGDSETINKLKNNKDVDIAKSEEELEDIEEHRRFAVGISQETKDIPATNRHMAIVKAGSEYQRDKIEVAGIRLIGKKEQDGDTYYNVSFESHPEVESQFNQPDWLYWLIRPAGILSTYARYAPCILHEFSTS